MLELILLNMLDMTLTGGCFTLGALIVLAPVFLVRWLLR